MKINKDYSRGFLMAASAYRRNSDSRLDFSKEALVAQYRHETYGQEKPDPSRNGFTYGKMALGITLTAMQQEYANGMFQKKELYIGSFAFVRREIRNWIPVRFFGF